MVNIGVEDAAPAGVNEISQIQEELDAARAEIERLEREAANAAARAGEAEAEAASLRSQLSAANDEATALAAESEGLRAQLAEASERDRASAAAYRELLLRHEPSLPADLVGGETVAAVEASVAAARETVARVRSHLAAQAESARVPAGSPPRAEPDVSAMTPAQKIRYGLDRARAE